MTNTNRRWEVYMKQYKNTTDRPPCAYCPNQAIQLNTSELQSHILTEHPGNEYKVVNFDPSNPLPCIFHLELGCNASFSRLEDDDWRSHIISHFGDEGPPNRMSCIFCEASFYVGEFFAHTFDHLGNGYKIKDSKPGHNVLTYMYMAKRISKEDYDHCMAYTDLRPLDYIPPERIEVERDTQVVVGNRAEMRRQLKLEKDRAKRLAPKAVQ